MSIVVQEDESTKFLGYHWAGTSLVPPVPAIQPYSNNALQFFDRLLTPPSATNAPLYAALIDGLATAGVWSLLDALWTFAAADQSTSLINLKSSSFQGSLNLSTGTPTFTAYSGWSGAGAPTTKSVNLNFNPSTAGGNYTQNNAMIGAWVIGTTTEQRGAIIQGSTNGNIEIYPRYSASPTYWSANGSAESTYISTSPAGMWLAQRTGASASALYLNGTSVATAATSSVALVNENLVSDTTANTTAACYIGASLTAPQITALYNGLQTYLHAVGAV